MPIYDDVRNLWWWAHETTRPLANIIIGGPPCQQTSKAAAIHGKRTGESLWPHMLKAGIEAAAEWFVVEQPPGNAAWEAQVTDDLSSAGYHVARFEFGACDIGAPYIRRRLFLVASTSLPRLEVAWRAIPSEIESVKRAANARGDWAPGKLAFIPVDDRSSEERATKILGSWRRKWVEAVGDSNPPHMAEVIGRAIMKSANADHENGTLT